MSLLPTDFATQTPVETARPDQGDCVPQDPAATDQALAAAEDAKLYLRHVEGGESIRALAREAGCHPSTMLRRIRKYEQRRDDPVVDRAIAQAGKRSDKAAMLRVLRRLAEPRAQLALSEVMDKAIVSRDDLRTAILPRALAQDIVLRGWVDLLGSGRIARYRLNGSGRAALRNLSRPGSPIPRHDDLTDARPVGVAEQAAGFDPAPSHADRHRLWEDRVLPDPEDGKRRRMRVNVAESPLGLLARRSGPDGQPFLGRDLVAAGERIREDYELAQMGPRVTQNWDGFMTAGIDSGRNGARLGGGSVAARDRVAAALRELGPGMGDIVLRVCCFLEGIEMTERRLGWSARSGKVVLKLALMRLERHYAETYGKGAPLIG
ncbi:DUF6456 domain-containing protein [Paracoccus jiaweipingae]